MPDPLLGALVLLHTLGAAIWFGGVVWIAIANRALRAHLADEARRGVVRHIGRAAAPALWGALAVAAATGAALWARSGYAAPPMAITKGALVLIAALLTAAHMRVGREGVSSGRSVAMLGMGTLFAGIALFFLGAGLRQI